ncbi:hypothetical protein C7437_1011048 [Psychrobacillus insolitus]|uniref:Uncharacterized protein n=1 Tax=Psychrobacillus insolitus TaxID=1461 RepID=A0A2W7PHW5_9BACI|nr:hypothetical protein [Psychrobacillus insolitus]PZX07926.1 hypothetical protein C7437_1011048 [Psychrobacillus insolitus]
MTPNERKKLKQEREKLKVYRNRLMALKDVMPHDEELWSDNDKIVKFFETGQARKYEDKLNLPNIKPGAPTVKRPKRAEITVELTVEKYKELKAKGVSDNAVKDEYGFHSNKFNAWKKKNNLMKTEADKVELTVAVYKELKAKGLTDQEIADKFDKKIGSVYQFKSVNGLTNQPIKPVENEAVSVEVDSAHLKDAVDTLEKELEETNIFASGEALRVSELEQQLHDSNLKNRGLETSLEVYQGNVSELNEASENARNAERKAIQELIDYEREYRKLEVDYHNQSGELTRLKAMLEKLKHTSQINVWLMKQHIGFVEQADELAEVNFR